MKFSAKPFKNILKGFRNIIARLLTFWSCCDKMSTEKCTETTQDLFREKKPIKFVD